MDDTGLAKSVVLVTRRIRRLFHLLGSVGTALHADTGVTAAMRAVMETIHEQGASTVAHMARMRPVSRQHIQRIVDELLARGLVCPIDNPFHKRSPLIGLTAAGASLFRAMLEREAVLVDQLAHGLDRDDLLATQRILEQFTTRLSAMMARQAGSSGGDHHADP